MSDLSLEIVERDGYAVAVLGGTRSPETLLAAAAETVARCASSGRDRVLIDIRAMRGGLDTLETFDVAGRQIPAQAGVRSIVRAAVLDRPDNLARIGFFETVAVNRGLNLRVFANEARAIGWLLSNREGDTRG
ncbi:MAG: hypothetical protein MUC56_09260 [Thermoanaerobaculales bacterium]|nr:hypothetical protein [Thermoanaerobaculales bacterium]